MSRRAAIVIRLVAALGSAAALSASVLSAQTPRREPNQGGALDLASEDQLGWVSPTSEWVVENADVRIAVMASENNRALSQVPPERQTRTQAARQHLMKRMMERSAAGEYRWALTLFPTNAYASEAGMSERMTRRRVDIAATPGAVERGAYGCSNGPSPTGAAGGAHGVEPALVVVHGARAGPGRQLAGKRQSVPPKKHGNLPL